MPDTETETETEPPSQSAEVLRRLSLEEPSLRVFGVETPGNSSSHILAMGALGKAWAWGHILCIPSVFAPMRRAAQEVGAGSADRV